MAVELRSDDAWLDGGLEGLFFTEFPNPMPIEDYAEYSRLPCPRRSPLYLTRMVAEPATRSAYREGLQT